VKIRSAFTVLKLTVAAVSATHEVRDEVRSIVHSDGDRGVRMTEMEYQPRGGTNGLVTRHWHKVRQSDTIRSHNAVLNDLQTIWASKRLHMANAVVTQATDVACPEAEKN
jgi:hypothetical protein